MSLLFMSAALTLTGLVSAFIGFAFQTWIVSGNATLDIHDRAQNAVLFEMVGWFAFCIGTMAFLLLITY